MKRLLMLLCLVSAPLAPAQIFYAGNPFAVSGNQSTKGFSCEMGVLVPDSRVYEQFTITSSQLSQTMFGHYLLPNFPVSSAYWELRAGVSQGNGGILIAAGVSTATVTNGPTVIGGFYTPFNPFLPTGTGFVTSRRVAVAVSFVLAPGTYQFTLVPMSSGPGKCYVLSTLGAGGVGIGVSDGIAWMDSTTWGILWDASVNLFSQGVDFSLGIG